MSVKPFVLALVLTVIVGSTAMAADARRLVEMPAPMQQHMLSNMRHHLLVLRELQSALAAGKFHRAASRFAVTVVEGDVPKSLDDLSKVTQQCVAYHAAYRLR